ncbi:MULTISPECIES: oxidoreductase [Gordonia]|uniref:Oxidoreductase n=2 Tax=Gordonia TaxID=2053 RepID=A0ABN3H0X6_9ACTN|nr:MULTISPECIES: oxidoreductase [Gordonia]AUH69897.1 short-chain dehydrogenase [Gordonia sp. YC-JH1]KJR08984.1 short-chain dehydrogenase [Gordonia sihwensis]KXT57081.1 short-chain dehydrogenase [Gordonia sp. QH-12]MBY4570530.1 short-chain dehydrogenase [Gordonia sihwensis]WFN93494.1 oxidoreductase [Gordonia sihwensis]
MSDRPTAGLPDQSGRTWVITGANSGLGAEIARAAAAAGADVTLACRNLDKAERVAGRIGASARVAHLDLADLGSVRDFAAGVEPFDVLVNNAGVMALPHRRTADGFEMQMGTNHLGHFALTGLLLPRVRERIVIMSSLAQNWGRIHADDLNWERRRYNRWAAYGDSKLANTVFGRELARRLTQSGSPVRAVLAHPGYTSTGLMGQSETPVDYLMKAGAMLRVGQPAAQGALPALFAATADVPNGSYWGPNRVLRGTPSRARYRAAADDQRVRDRLWSASEELTGVTFDV